LLAEAGEHTGAESGSGESHICFVCWSM
jgi:hypothetical protein